jgi:hypothetical protein
MPEFRKEESAVQHEAGLCSRFNIHRVRRGSSNDVYYLLCMIRRYLFCPALPNRVSPRKHPSDHIYAMRPR